MRLDIYLTNIGFFDSRNKASTAIKSGMFAVNGTPILKPAYNISDSDSVTVLKEQKNYVARSAHKLLTAYKVFSLSFKDKIVVDLGASTGGFCQILLEKGAKQIYAVDIGTAQLHPTIKTDPRIINMEHTNARYLSKSSFDQKIDVITADLSFISIKAVVPAISSILGECGEAILLIKPQFEAGPEHLNKSGVVSDRKVQLRVLKEIIDFVRDYLFGIEGISFSGLPGESGNREYLLYLRKNTETKIDINEACNNAILTEETHE